MTPKKPWWAKGIHFSCTCSSQCCRTNGEYAYVYMTRAEVTKAAAHMHLSVSDFRRQYIVKEDGHYYIKDPKRDCVFLTSEGTCGIYAARPRQCRDWPFWKENLLAPEVWENEVVPICRGCRNGMQGEGRFHSREEIQQMLDDAEAATDD